MPHRELPQGRPHEWMLCSDGRVPRRISTLTLQYDKVDLLDPAGHETDKVAAKHVTVFDYPDGRFESA